MGDPFQKVQRGQRLRIPAETFNTFIDAAKDFRQRTQNRTRRGQPELPPAGTILVKNGTDRDLDRFDVLGIQRPIFTPVESLFSFQNQPAVIGVTPNEEAHFGRFVVLQEPLKRGMIGRACLSGLTHVRLNVLDEDDEFADVETGCCENLTTGTAGSAFILWKEPAEYGGPGAYPGGCYSYGYGYELLRWALVRIGNLSDGDQWGTV